MSLATVELEQETDGRWLAEYKGIPGMMVYGATIGEALRKLADLLQQSEERAMSSSAQSSCVVWPRQIVEAVEEYSRLQKGFADGTIGGEKNMALLNQVAYIGECVVRDILAGMARNGNRG